MLHRGTLVTLRFPVGPACPYQFMGGRVGTDYHGAGFVMEQSQISEGQAHGPPFGWVGGHVTGYSPTPPALNVKSGERARNDMHR